MGDWLRIFDWADGLVRRWAMVKFLLWCILFVLCWPLALLALLLYPVAWLLLLPFRVVGIAVGGGVGKRGDPAAGAGYAGDLAGG